MKVPRTKRFKGKTYWLYSRNFTSRGARNDVDKLHKRGKNARVVSFKNDPLYYVYSTEYSVR